MSYTKTINVALIGNPNTGKTSLFNALTGLNQKVGNYPGVTVDKKEGQSKLQSNFKAIITDLPGTYSINPTSLDETIVLKTLLNSKTKKTPDVIVVVADVENLKRNLLLFSQVKDLEIPIVLAINMADQMKRKGISIDLNLLKKELSNEVVLLSVRKNPEIGIEEIKKAIVKTYNSAKASPLCNVNHRIDPAYFDRLKEINPKIEFSSDFIIGYPGEEDRDFKDTLNLIEKVKFINSYSFIFSPRPGTVAENLDLIKKKISIERLEKIQSILSENQIRMNNSLKGKVVDVLVENLTDDKNKAFGRSMYMTSVIFNGKKNDIGKIVQVRIKDSNRNTLFGEVITNSDQKVA